MYDKDKLIKSIEEDCLLVKSYDMFSMTHLVSAYVYKNKIKLDSADWLYLVDELWSELKFIRLQFDDIEKFEFELRDGV